jgi:hypothetical protein
MCFYFLDTQYADTHPHKITDLNDFMDRLDEEDFKASPTTNWQELGARITLLDIAVDDGRCDKIDLSIPKSAENFDEDVDTLVATINNIMRSLGNPGAAFISRIEAKEVLELVSQRLSDTLRTRPKRKLMHFETPTPRTENLNGEKAGMSAFLSRKRRDPPKSSVTS